MIELSITPIGKPRMTQRDRWKKRPVVLGYFAFKDHIRILMGGRRLPDAGWHVTFVLPMPTSWSKKRKQEMCGKPHQQKPDKDNLEKALLDSLFEDDSCVWDGRVTKVWGYAGRIIITECGEPDAMLQRIRDHESQARML